jgi:large subunit ribosomal protein L15
MRKLHNLAPASGSRRPKRRVGRGIAGKGGKTAGRGMKGALARDTVPAGFEGGQLPLMQRVPKLRGFTNPFRIEYTPVNLDVLEELAAGGATEVDPDRLVDAGVARKGALVKILGRGELSRSVRVRAHAFSGSAESAITSAGGSVERVPLPYASGRPPARGNALTNR